MDVPVVTKRVEILQTKYIDRVAAMLVVMQQQAPQAQTSAKIVEVPPAKFAETAVDVPAKITPLMVRQVTQLQTVLKTGKVLRVQLMSVCTSRSPTCQCPMLRSMSAFRSVCTNRSLMCQCLKKSKRTSSQGVEIQPPVVVQRQVPQFKLW